MADFHQLPSVEDAEREASEWIARLNADDVSTEDRARFEAWRGAHPRHARAFEELSATWRQFTDVGRQDDRRPGVLRRAFVMAAAASLAAVVFGGGWWWIETSSPRTLFQTAIGERASVELPDRSSFELNSNSLARVE